MTGPGPTAPSSGTAPNDSPAAGRRCPACGDPVAPGARFCEACGAPLPPDAAVVAGVPRSSADPDGAPFAASAPTASPTGAPGAPPCAECGGAVDVDGYCTTCGAKARSPRDHVVESPQPWVGAVSDTGLRRSRNEDAVATAASPVPGDFAALVVCDGVASAEDSDVASLAAARAARDVLVASRPGEHTDATAAARLASAADAASRAVAAATPNDHGQSPPSCTWVAALLEGGQITAGVVGDSRAYWVPDAGDPRQLTTDDSMAAELEAAGMTRAEAEAGPFGHTITRWLGVDSPGHAPRLTAQAADGAGWLLVCSDGLWNYCSAPADLAAVLRRAVSAAGGEPVATAAALVDWANAQGGHDNITVALARVDPVR